MPMKNPTHPGDLIKTEVIEVRAEPRAPNKKTVAAMRELQRGGGKRFKTTQKLFDDWKK